MACGPGEAGGQDSRTGWEAGGKLRPRAAELVLGGAEPGLPHVLPEDTAASP